MLIKDNHIKVAGGIAEAGVGPGPMPPKMMKIMAIDVNIQQAALDVIMLTAKPSSWRRPCSSSTIGRLSRYPAASMSRPLAAVVKSGVDVISVGALTHMVNSISAWISAILNKRGGPVKFFRGMKRNFPLKANIG